MPQFDERTDEVLNGYERQLAKAVADKEEAEKKYDALFLQVFHEFDEYVGEGTPVTFIADDGYKLARLVPVMQPVINNDKLQALIDERYSDEEARRLWLKITVPTRVVLQNKLAQAMKADSGLGAAINDAGDIIVTPVRKPSRIRKEATQKEILQARVNLVTGEEATG